MKDLLYNLKNSIIKNIKITSCNFLYPKWFLWSITISRNL